MTDHGELNDAKEMLLKEKEENNSLKKTISQKDETIESLKRWLQIYQNSSKEHTLNVEAKNNIIDCMKEIDDLRENDIDDFQFNDIITDNVDELVDFVNRDVIGDEMFLQNLDAPFDLGSEVAVEKLDNIDINELATFSDFSLAHLSKDDSHDDVVSEVMSSPFDIFGVGSDSDPIKYDQALLADSINSEVQILNSGEPMDQSTQDVPVEEVLTVEDDLLDVVDILDSSCDEIVDIVREKKLTPKKRIKRQSDIRITDSAKKWLVENDFKKLYESDPQLPRNLNGSDEVLKEHGLKDMSHQPLLKLDGKGETDKKGPVLSKMFDCSKCGISFSMDRKDVLNSFHKPGTPKCPDCQTSPRAKDTAKVNFHYSRKNVAEKIKMENKTKTKNSKLMLSSAATHPQVELKTTKQSHLQCETCGKRFPMGGEWKFKKHMEIHMGGTKEANNCEVCHESFKYKSTLMAHLKTHEGKDPFQCNLCHKDFKGIDELVNHGVLDHKRRSVRGLLDLLGTESK